jgi:AcrR family transcriptional regulator
MSGAERRAQLLAIARELFADKGFDGTSIEEIAGRAGVSKPVVYEHFGSKERVYVEVVELAVHRMLDKMTSALGGGSARALLEQAALALLEYIEEDTPGFRILVRDSPVASSTGNFASLISDIASRVEHILGREFATRGFDQELAPLYSQALVGMVALTGQWWLDVREPAREEVAAHLVNLAWNGLSGMEREPRLVSRTRPERDESR